MRHLGVSLPTVVLPVTLVLYACGGGSAPGAKVIATLEEELKAIQVTDGKICGVFSKTDRFVCFDTGGNITVDAPLPEGCPVSETAVLADGRILLAGWTLDASAGWQYKVAWADLDTGSISEPLVLPIESRQGKIIYSAAVGLSDGTWVVVDADILHHFSASGESLGSTSVDVLGEVCVPSENNLQGTADGRLGVLHGLTKAELSFLDAEGNVLASFTNELANCNDAITFPDANTVWFMRGAYNGNGDLSHEYADVYSIDGAFIETKAFPCPDAAACDRNRRLDDGHMVVQCTDTGGENLMFELLLLSQQ